MLVRPRLPSRGVPKGSTKTLLLSFFALVVLTFCLLPRAPKADKLKTNAVGPLTAEYVEGGRGVGGSKFNRAGLTDYLSNTDCSLKDGIYLHLGYVELARVKFSNRWNLTPPSSMPPNTHSDSRCGKGTFWKTPGYL